MDKEKDYWLWLTYIKDMWGGKARKVMEVFETPEELYRAGEALLKKTGIFSEADIYNITAAQKNGERQLENIWKKLEAKQIKFTCIGQKDYPKRLLVYADKPLWLFYKGSLPDEDEKLVGMVGARNCSRYGASMAEQISSQVSGAAVGIISGMARGIDAAAHRGALEAGARTYAVLGCGVDICYPRENIELYMHILSQGGVMSEYIPGTEPLNWQFPERNRIISMFADAVAVIEAKRNSGSLITTDYALQYGKEVFAMPGRVGDELSRGCNELIKSGASLLTEGADMLYAIGMFDETKHINEKNNCKILLEKENEVVYSCLGLLPQNIEDIIAKTGKTSSEVFGVLMQLMVKGLVVEPVKNHYARRK